MAKNERLFVTIRSGYTRKFFERTSLYGKDCFVAWFTMGSLNKATEALKDKVKTVTGKPVGYQQVREYAFVWMLENLQEAREIYKSKSLFHDDNEWNMYVVKLARRTYKGRPEFLDWAIRNGVYEELFDLIAPLYNLSENQRNILK